MSTNPDEFFGGGGDYVPGWWTGQVGNSIAGTIIENPVVQLQTDFDTGQPIYEERDGQRVIDPETGQPRVKKQLRVVLQTALRNWQGLKNPPLDRETQQPRNPAEDDGRRAVYVKGWMTGAVGDAVRAAGATGAPKKGGKLAVRVTELVQPQRRGGYPYPKFEARYEPPNPGDAMFAEQPAPQAAAPQQAAQQAPAAPQAPQQGQWGAPQQAPQQQGWGQQPGGAPVQQQGQAWGPPQVPAQQGAPQAPQQPTAAPQAPDANPWNAPPAQAPQGDPWGGQGFGDTPTF